MKISNKLKKIFSLFFIISNLLSVYQSTSNVLFLKIYLIHSMFKNICCHVKD